jgi:hypothetical protein
VLCVERFRASRRGGALVSAARASRNLPEQFAPPVCTGKVWFAVGGLPASSHGTRRSPAASTRGRSRAHSGVKRSRTLSDRRAHLFVDRLDRTGALGARTPSARSRKGASSCVMGVVDGALLIGGTAARRTTLGRQARIWRATCSPTLRFCARSKKLLRGSAPRAAGAYSLFAHVVVADAKFRSTPVLWRRLLAELCRQ